MPLFKRSRGGVTSNQIVVADIKAEVIDTNLITGVSTAHDTLASALAIKNYIDNEVGAFDTFKKLLDTNLDDTTSYGDNQHVQYDGNTSRWINRPFIEFDKITAPADPDAEEGRLYLKEINTANNALAVKIQKANTIVEVELTSPGATCECGSTDGAKDPVYNFETGKMTVELYCGHIYEMDIPNLRRIM